MSFHLKACISHDGGWPPLSALEVRGMLGLQAWIQRHVAMESGL